MLQNGSSIMMGKVHDKKNEQKEETVDDLLHKLAKKGKKVKLLDETGSVKELKRDSAFGEEFDRDGDNINVQDVDDDFDDGQPAPGSSVKKRMKKIKE